MPTFDDKFTYSQYARTAWGKVFFDCVLLKDMGFEFRTKGSEIRDLAIDGILGHSWVPLVGADGILYEFATLKLKKYYVAAIFDEIRKDIITKGDCGLEYTEDRLGIIVPQNRIYRILDGYYTTMLEDYNRAACTLQLYWKRCVSNPKYKICRRRLQREFEEMNV